MAVARSIEHRFEFENVAETTFPPMSNVGALATGQVTRKSSGRLAVQYVIGGGNS
jgi:hypothetical protein